MHLNKLKRKENNIMEEKNVIDEIVEDTINDLEKVQDTFNTDSIDVLNEDAEFENVSEVETNADENN
jgi:hypothetical protein